MPSKSKRKVINPKITSKVDRTYFCTCCGKIYATGEKNFYILRNSPVYKANNGFAHICTNCVKELFEHYKEQFNDQRLATMIMCAKLDIPYYHSLYESVNAKNDFSFGVYVRQLNGTQYKGKTFATTLSNGELERTVKESVQEAEEYWTIEEKRAKNEVIKLLGRDPFINYSSKDRRYLFIEFLQYLDDDELLDDQYKMTQLIQLINNNNQINQYDIALSKLNPTRDVDEVTALNRLKKDLVTSNDKIAKENGFSVKSRGDNRVGKGTLTSLMREMREKNIKEIEVNFYDQLHSENTRWAADVSAQSLKTNCRFDENDINDMLEEQRSLITKLQNDLDTLKEGERVWKTERDDTLSHVNELEEQVEKLQTENERLLRNNIEEKSEVKSSG